MQVASQWRSSWRPATWPVVPVITTQTSVGVCAPACDAALSSSIARPLIAGWILRYLLVVIVILLSSAAFPDAGMVPSSAAGIKPAGRDRNRRKPTIPRQAADCEPISQEDAIWTSA